MYIAEYEQNGKDRASYGDKLLENLSSTLFNYGLSRAEERELRRHRQFYQTYPQIQESLTPELKPSLPASKNVSSQIAISSRMVEPV